MQEQIITKDRFSLVDNYYAHPNTSTLCFRFEPKTFTSSQSRLEKSSMQYASIDGKNLFIIDNLFSLPEKEVIRNFSATATFSRKSYGSPEAIEKGEKPAYSMNNKERWQFFSNPPKAVSEVYKLLSMFGAKLNADITTLPWELCDPSSYGSPAVIANKLEIASTESMELGKHQDYNPRRGISFAIPMLYSPKKESHANHFNNGETGKPYLISVMLYVTAENFMPEYCMGTIFYDDSNQKSLRVNCSNTRLVLFEGDIFHSIENSTISSKIKTWRVSYVFKIIINPRKQDQNIPEELFNLLKQFSEMKILELGPSTRA